MSIRSIDIAICTWNRSVLLRRTLESLTRMTIPSDLAWRVIVVSNCCTDDTPGVLDSFQARLPLLVAGESQQGHAFARNRAVSLASADLVAWTDDDVEVAPDWLEVTRLAAEKYPEAAFFGGKIVARFPDGEPDWVRENRETLSGCFAERDIGDQPVWFTRDRLPYGANFAVRGEVQRDFLFRTDTGRIANLVTGEDEIDFLRRLIDSGHRGIWVPASRVEHLITRNRATREYISDYFYGQGRMLIRKGTPWTRNRLRLAASEWWHKFRFQRTVCSSPSGVWLAHLARYSLARGQRDALRKPA